MTGIQWLLPSLGASLTMIVLCLSLRSGVKFVRFVIYYQSSLTGVIKVGSVIATDSLSSQCHLLDQKKERFEEKDSRTNPEVTDKRCHIIKDCRSTEPPVSSFAVIQDISTSQMLSTVCSQRNKEFQSHRYTFIVNNKSWKNHDVEVILNEGFG